MTRKAETPPSDLKQQIEQIAAISQNARTTWFGLIALTLFVGVTLLAHTDADFFARDAATTLPILNIDVPVIAFFVMAPLLVTAIHVYLQVYLVTLWDALGRAPAQVEDAPLADRVFPWLMSHAALQLRTRQRKVEKDAPSANPRAMGWLVEATSATLGWVFPLAILTALWLRSMPLHSEWLTGWIAVCLWVSSLVACAGFFAMRRAMAKPNSTTGTNVWVGIWGAAALSFGLCTTFEVTWVTNSTRWFHLSQDQRNRLPTWLPKKSAITPFLPGRARLEEVRLTPRPKGWKPFELWLEDERRANLRDDGIRKDDRWGDPKQDPMIPNAEEMKRWRLLIAELDAPSLKERDLRDANARGAFLPGADLRGANLTRADLREARLDGANLTCARDPVWKNDEKGGYIADESLCVRLQGADLREARMDGANLFGARMEGANLFGARMEGADLRGAWMEGANLNWARMEGANLFGAQMGGSKCTSVAFLATLVHSADLTCHNLSQANLKLAVGDSETLLPPGRTVWSCLARDALSEKTLDRIDGLLQHHPKESDDPFRVTRGQFERVLFCDPNDNDPLRRRPILLTGKTIWVPN